MRIRSAIAFLALAACEPGEPVSELRPRIEVTPARVEFTSVVRGHPQTRTLSIKNAGDAPLSIASVRVDEGDGFRLLESFMPRAIAPSETVELTVAFATEGGVRSSSGRLFVTSDDPDRPEVAVALFGTQLTSVPLGCDLVLRPTRLELSTIVPVGTIELQNLGAQPCNISALSVESRCDFMATSPAGLPIRLDTGEAAEVSVAWTPGLEVCEGTLSIDSDDPLRPSRTIELHASPTPDLTCHIAYDPGVLDFGVIRVGAASSRIVRITNITGNNCQIGHPDSDEPALVAYQRTDARGALLPGTTVEMVATLRPIAAGSIEGAISFPTDDAENLVVRIPVSGIGVTRQICVDPNELHFETGTSSTSRPVTIRACGDRPLYVRAASFSTGDPELAVNVDPPFPWTLAPGESRAVVVSWTAADDEGDTAVLDIGSDDPVLPISSVHITAGGEVVPLEAGRYLYFWRIVVDADESGIYRIPLQGDPQPELFWGPGNQKPCSGCHSISPDGRFVALVEDGLLGDLRIVDLSNGSDHLLGVEVQGPVAWRPDVGGTLPYRFAFSDGANVRIGSAVSEETPPILIPRAQIANGPAWSSAGRIAFNVSTESSSGLVIYSEDGIDSVAAGPSVIVEAGPPVFTPDGVWVAAVTSRGMVTLFDTRDPQNLFHDVAGTDRARSPRFSFDGRWLSFASDRAGGQGDYDIWVMPFDPAAADATGPAFNFAAANSPASERAAYWSR